MLCRIKAAGNDKNYYCYPNLNFTFPLNLGGSDGEASACSEETWVQFLGQEDPLEKEMATHSSTLA